MRAVLVVLAAALVVLASTQSPAADKITSLPLWSGPLGNQYSGYINVGNGRNLHYWFVEAESNPSQAPVVLWLNGGPGCSSLDGFFYEMGPIHFGQSEDVTLVKNPNAWTSIANMIFLESPAGVGFSYYTGSSPQYNDTGVAEDNYIFLQKWFTMYPQYKSNDFWISGESYAGVYVPSLAKNVLQGVLDKSFVVPFKGVLVGNGVTNADGDNLLNDPVDFLYGHGIISPQTYKTIVAACTDPNNPSRQCQSLFNQAMNNMDDIDMYDVTSDCYHQRSPNSGSPPCIDSDHARTYLSQAIHVRPLSNWQICNDEINAYYDRTEDSMVPIYKFLLKNQRKVLIYSGDTDFAVPYTGTAYWTSSMGLTPVQPAWRQWRYKDDEGMQVAGFVTEYEEGLTFATVRGAGHMVPQFRPEAALNMFTKFISGQKL